MDILKQLKLMNAVRSPAAFGHSIDDMELTFWATAVAGETGEMCNIIKKALRGDKKYSPENREQFENDVASEAADIVCYLDMLMQKLGLDLGRAIVEKFNKVSKEKNVPFILKMPE